MTIYTTPYFWFGVLDRAIKTFAQTIIALIGTNVIAIHELHWVTILSVSATATLLSVLTSVATPEIASHTRVSKDKDGQLVAYIPKHSQENPRL